jgi:opacity protein-like surface antigen
MMPRSLIAAVAVILSLGGRAFAQAVAASSPPSPRKWDAQAGIGTSGGKNRVADPAVPASEVSVEAGRYWWNHLRTAVTLTNAGGTTYPAYATFPEGFTETRLSARGAVTLSGVVGYQFGMNLFLHPYVAAGVRMAWLTETQERYATSLPYHSTTSTPTSELRPLLGGGFKAYFGRGLIFVRPEFMMVVGSGRPTHSTLRFMVGRDF